MKPVQMSVRQALRARGMWTNGQFLLLGDYIQVVADFGRQNCHPHVSYPPHGFS
jgi:hypothetical protein